MHSLAALGTTQLAQGQQQFSLIQVTAKSELRSRARLELRISAQKLTEDSIAFYWTLGGMHSGVAYGHSRMHAGTQGTKLGGSGGDFFDFARGLAMRTLEILRLTF